MHDCLGVVKPVCCSQCIGMDWTGRRNRLSEEGSNGQMGDSLSGMSEI